MAHEKTMLPFTIHLIIASNGRISRRSMHYQPLLSKIPISSGNPSRANWLSLQAMGWWSYSLSELRRWHAQHSTAKRGFSLWSKAKNGICGGSQLGLEAVVRKSALLESSEMLSQVTRRSRKSTPRQDARILRAKERRTYCRSMEEDR